MDATLVRLEEGGGAHDQFWRRFNSFLNEIAAEVSANNEADAVAVISQLQELQLLLTAQGANAGSWLSIVRNQINYQHQFGTWFPFGATEDVVRHVARIGYMDISKARLDFSAAKEPLQALCTGSLFLAALSFDVATQLINRTSGRSGHFVRNWQRLTIETGL